MSGRRGMIVALVVTGLGALLVLATAGQSRWSIGGAALRGGAAPAATALALVALAGIGLLLLIGGFARSAVGLLLILSGVAVVLVNARTTALSGFGSLTLQPAAAAQRSVWFWLTAGGGVVLSGGGLIVAIWGHRWPRAKRDYRAPAEPVPLRRDAWTSLDRGEDPTV